MDTIERSDSEYRLELELGAMRNVIANLSARTIELETRVNDIADYLITTSPETDDNEEDWDDRDGDWDYKDGDYENEDGDWSTEEEDWNGTPDQGEWNDT